MNLLSALWIGLGFAIVLRENAGLPAFTLAVSPDPTEKRKAKLRKANHGFLKSDYGYSDVNENVDDDSDDDALFEEYSNPWRKDLK